MIARYWAIKPTPWVRESQKDRWAPRPSVLRYRAFRDECRYRKIWSPEPGNLIVYLMPIPKSRSREGLAGMPHQQVPDLDNLTKALLDACFKDDAHIWGLQLYKIWSDTPGIYIERRKPGIALPFTV